ncbi:MAG: hypothetical protein ACLROH_04050 [Streptococcus sp.]
MTAFVLTLATFFTASGFTGGYGMDFRAFMLTLISMFFTIYAFQVTGFFVRRVFFKTRNIVMVAHLKSLDAYPSTIYHLLCLLS